MPHAAPGPELREIPPVRASPAFTPASQKRARRGPRIEMDIVQLLNVLLCRSDIEVIRPGLPECGRQPFAENGELLFGCSFPCTASEWDTLLQHLRDPARVCDFWFANQMMDVLGHDDVTSHDELVFLACLFEDCQKNITVLG